MAKAFILAMSSLEDDTTNQHEDEEDGKEADGGDKPGLSDSLVTLDPGRSGG